MHAAHSDAVGGQRRHSPLLGTLLNIQLVVLRMVRVRGARARRSRRGTVRARDGGPRVPRAVHGFLEGTMLTRATSTRMQVRMDGPDGS